MNDKAPSLQHLNRTVIGSVLFIDIVGYSRGTVPEQIAMKEVFNRLLIEAVENVAPSDRIMVDTGDGAGVAFLGDPEDALFAALSLRDAIDAGKVTTGEPGFVRMGINLGPLKMVRDINGHTNMIGDAVNDAQRVMSFASPGQVMVSYSYYDIISRFSLDYATLFTFEGARRDKHVREHQVYSFGPNVGTEILTEKLRDRSRARSPDLPERRNVAHLKAAFFAKANASPARPAAPGENRWPIRVGMLAAIIACVAAAAAGATAWYLHAGWPTEAARRIAAPAPAPVAAAGSDNKAAAANPVPILAPTVDAKTAPINTAAAGGAMTVSLTNAPHSPNAASAIGAAGPAGAPSGMPADTASAKPGTVSLSIAPWGEIFVDGASSGVSPPLKSLTLAPGKHKIEIRNSDFAPFKKTIQVKSDADIAVHYDF